VVSVGRTPSNDPYRHDTGRRVRGWQRSEGERLRGRDRGIGHYSSLPHRGARDRFAFIVLSVLIANLVCLVLVLVLPTFT
jgi:hypothetical protein